MRSRSFLPLLLVLAALGASLWLWQGPKHTPIRIGVIHSLTGVMAESERGLVDALRLSVEELNANGGVLGQPVEMLVADSRSDPSTAANEARRLIMEERVQALFGCWTSACRKAVRTVVEEQDGVLFYPLQHEGLEQSAHIVYLGAAPNQQILPGTRWALDRFGKRAYLIGSDYVFPRIANLMVRDMVVAAGGTVEAEHYEPLSTTDFTRIAARIRHVRPDFVISTLNGASNEPFFAALLAVGLGDIPVVSFSVGEAELQAMASLRSHPAHFAVWGYFQSLPSASNQDFVESFRARFGHERVTSDPIETSYNAVRLWARAVEASGTSDPVQILNAVGRQGISAPSGTVAIDAATRHAWRRAYAGHARSDGQFDIEPISTRIVRPTPFPPYRSRDAWIQRVGGLSIIRPGPATPEDLR